MTGRAFMSLLTAPLPSGASTRPPKPPAHNLPPHTKAPSRYKVADLAVSPDDPNVVAVGRVNVGFSPPGEGVAVFNNGAQLSQTTPGHVNGSDSIVFSPAGTTLYGTGQSHGLKQNKRYRAPAPPSQPVQRWPAAPGSNIAAARYSAPRETSPTRQPVLYWGFFPVL